MPIYRYRCKVCGWEEEHLEPMSAPKERHDIHPYISLPGYHNCDGTLIRIPTAFSFKFNCSMPTYRKGQ